MDKKGSASTKGNLDYLWRMGHKNRYRSWIFNVISTGDIPPGSWVWNRVPCWAECLANLTVYSAFSLLCTQCQKYYFLSSSIPYLPSYHFNNKISRLTLR